MNNISKLHPEFLRRHLFTFVSACVLIWPAVSWALPLARDSPRRRRDPPMRSILTLEISTSAQKLSRFAACASTSARVR